LGIEGEFMSDMGSWLSILGGVLGLVGITIGRRRPGVAQIPVKVWNAMTLVGVASIVGPLPWALDIGSDTVRIGASALSILASLLAIATFARWIWEGAWRHDA
jgi:hypothetical protein